MAMAKGQKVVVKKDLCAEQIRKILRYDKRTGLFFWLVAKSRRIHVGDVAGSQHSDGYISIFINGRPYYAHRLAWLYVTGRWPKIRIDHKNRKKSDNRFCNLREATFSQNGMNASLSKLNTSGFRGVNFVRAEQKWRAMIRTPGKRIFLGHFETAEAAGEAYAKAAQIYHQEFSSI